jgi:hypothetical protein
MRGKRARELRRAARMLLGPDAPAVDYEIVQQRDNLGGAASPKVAVDEFGKQICLPGTEIPFILSMGIEPRLKLECVKGMTKKLKRNYVNYRKKSKKSLDVVRKLSIS